MKPHTKGPLELARDEADRRGQAGRDALLIHACWGDDGGMASLREQRQSR